MAEDQERRPHPRRMPLPDLRTAGNLRRSHHPLVLRRGCQLGKPGRILPCLQCEEGGTTRPG